VKKGKKSQPKKTTPKWTATQKAVDDAFCFAINVDRHSAARLVALFNILIQGAAECVEAFNTSHEWSAAKAKRFYLSKALGDLDGELQTAAIPHGTPIT
jgi:hypothetical protein